MTTLVTTATVKRPVTLAHPWRTVRRNVMPHRGAGAIRGARAATLGLSISERTPVTVPIKRRALAERRRVVGYTQERLAEVLGVERSTVVRWEAGETTPQPWCRPKIAGALAVPVDELDSMLAEGQSAD